MNLFPPSKVKEERIFWFVLYIVTVVFIYSFCVTFGHIPKENMRIADTTLTFFLGTVVGSAVGYLLGGSADKKTDKSANTSNNTENTTNDSQP